MRLAGSAERVDVAGDPGVAQHPRRSQVLVGLLVALGDRGKVLQLVGLDQFGPEMHDQRGFRVAAVNAEAVLDVGIDVLGPELAPAGLHRQHPLAHPQFARDDIENRDIAAMRVDEDDLPDPRPRHFEPDLGPVVDQVGRGVADRADLPDMLVRLAHRLHRQDADIEIGGRAFDQEVEVPLVDDRVGPHRQVRAVLLDRRGGEDRNGFFRVDAGEIGGGEIAPPDLALGHGLSQAGVAAMASISTTNSGRAKPETIIRVEAGSGSPNSVLRTSI